MIQKKGTTNNLIAKIVTLTYSNRKITPKKTQKRCDILGMPSELFNILDVILGLPRMFFTNSGMMKKG